MEFLGWTAFVLPSLEGNSLLNSLIGISHAEFACFRLAAGEFLGWKPLVSPCFTHSWVDFPEEFLGS